MAVRTLAGYSEWQHSCQPHGGRRWCHRLSPLLGSNKTPFFFLVSVNTTEIPSIFTSTPHSIGEAEPGKYCHLKLHGKNGSTYTNYRQDTKLMHPVSHLQNQESWSNITKTQKFRIMSLEYRFSDYFSIVFSFSKSLKWKMLLALSTNIAIWLTGNISEITPSEVLAVPWALWWMQVQGFSCVKEIGRWDLVDLQKVLTTCVVIR